MLKACTKQLLEDANYDLEKNDSKKCFESISFKIM